MVKTAGNIAARTFCRKYNKCLLFLFQRTNCAINYRNILYVKEISCINILSLKYPCITLENFNKFVPYSNKHILFLCD